MRSAPLSRAAWAFWCGRSFARQAPTSGCNLRTSSLRFSSIGAQKANNAVFHTAHAPPTPAHDTGRVHVENVVSGRTDFAYPRVALLTLRNRQRRSRIEARLPTVKHSQSG